MNGKETFSLPGGAEIPRVGLGVWMIPDEQTEAAVCEAFRMGYRHVDTAQAYGNEAGVGRALRGAGLAREEIFVTSKVAAEHKTYREAADSIDGSLLRMKTDYLDLMLIHSPQPWAEFRGPRRYFEENREVWRAMEDAQRAGKLRAIGVSNFLVDDLENLLAGCTIRPAVHQLLAHPGNLPQAILDFCRREGILCEAYSPLGHGEALKNPAVRAAAAHTGASEAQVCLRFLLDEGLVVLPKAGKSEHMRRNLELDFELSPQDRAALRETAFADYGEHAHFPVFSGR